jgi:molybdopterin molybdotransferase
MAVTIYEALVLIEKNLPSLSTEIVPIELALGRVAAQTRRATIALPTFNNSAMDGYGLCGEAERYTIKGKILAGDSHSYDLKEGECIKILTGARVPASIDTIIPQENVRATDTTITIEKPVSFGANIRYRGEDINENEVILSEGETITAAHIALLASQGVTHVKIYRQVRVAVFASGSELKLHFEPLGPSQVYNSNTYHLLSRCEELGCETRFAGKSEDNVESLKRLVTSALDCDLIVTSGGVSVGEADFTREAFGALGMETLFQKVQIKPGKPTTFGKIGNTLILNLPGNPLASALNFELFGTFLIRKLQGCRDAYHAPVETVAAEEILSPRPVANVIPGFFDGSSFTPAEKFAPGMVNVLNRCNGIIVIDPETQKIESGEKVRFLPIKWCFGTEKFTEFMS